MKIHQIAVDHTYKIDHPLLIRHILLETVEEISNNLIKNSKPYRVYFGYNMLAHFLNEDDAYYKKISFIMMMELLMKLNSLIVQNI